MSAVAGLKDGCARSEAVSVSPDGTLGDCMILLFYTDATLSFLAGIDRLGNRSAFTRA